MSSGFSPLLLLLLLVVVVGAGQVDERSAIGLTHCNGDATVLNGPSISTALHRAASKIHVDWKKIQKKY